MSRTVHRDPREDHAQGVSLQASERPAAADVSVEEVFLHEGDRMQQRRVQEQNYRRTVALASAAHELKTPLAVLSGYGELLLSEKLGPLTAKQRQVLLEME